MGTCGVADGFTGGSTESWEDSKVHGTCTTRVVSEWDVSVGADLEDAATGAVRWSASDGGRDGWVTWGERTAGGAEAWSGIPQ